MRTCPSCGFHNPETRERCLKCESLLVHRDLPDGSAAADRRPPLIDFRTIMNRAEGALEGIFGGSVPEGLPMRFPWTAAALSLIPGGGQFYNSQPRKALVFVLVWLVLVATFIITITNPWNNLVAVALLFWLFYVLGDGYVTAKRINGNEWNFRQVVAVWFAMMFFVGVTLAICQFMGTMSLFYLVTLRSPALEPQMRRGDKYFVLGPAFRPEPRPGSVVYYDPGRYTSARPGAYGLEETSIINERNGFGVVTAGPGEVVSVGADGVVRIDGTEAPAHRLRPNANGTPRIADLRADAGQHIVLISHGTIETSLIGQIVGGSFQGSLMPPRHLPRLRDYEQACLTKPDDIHGLVLFCYYPPQSRRWFGFDGGLWKTPPPTYPQPLQ